MDSRKLLIEHLGPAVAKVLVGAAFGTPTVTIGGSVLDFLKGKLGDRAKAKEAEQRFAKLSEASIAPLVQIFRAEAAKDSNPEAVALALADTLEQNVNPNLLLRHDLNPEKVHKAVLRARPLVAVRRQAYSSADISLYRRALPALLSEVIRIAPQLDGFAVADSAEILRRLSEQAEKLSCVDERASVIREDTAAIRAGLEDLHETFVGIAAFNEKRALDYTRQYVDHVGNHLNAVELFGISSDPSVRRQRLSTAYIPLSVVQGDQNEDAGGAIYFDDLLRRLTPERPRLLVVGGAGSGVAPVRPDRRRVGAPF